MYVLLELLIYKDIMWITLAFIISSSLELSHFHNSERGNRCFMVRACFCKINHPPSVTIQEYRDINRHHCGKG